MDSITGSVSRIITRIGGFLYRACSSIRDYIWTSRRERRRGRGPYIIPLYNSDETAQVPLMKPRAPYDPLKAVFTKKRPRYYRFEITSGSSSSDITLEPTPRSNDEYYDETNSMDDEATVCDEENVISDEVNAIVDEGNAIRREGNGSTEQSAAIGQLLMDEEENITTEEPSTIGQVVVTVEEENTPSEEGPTIVQLIN